MDCLSCGANSKLDFQFASMVLRPATEAEIAAVRRRAAVAPALFVGRLSDRSVLPDKIHRTPEMFTALHWLIDHGRREGREADRIVLPGSASGSAGHPTLGASWEGFAIENLLAAAPRGTTASSQRAARLGPRTVVRGRHGFGHLSDLRDDRGLPPQREWPDSGASLDRDPTDAGRKHLHQETLRPEASVRARDPTSKLSAAAGTITATGIKPVPPTL